MAAAADMENMMKMFSQKKRSPLDAGILLNRQ